MAIKFSLLPLMVKYITIKLISYHNILLNYSEVRLNKFIYIFKSKIIRWLLFLWSTVLRFFPTREWHLTATPTTQSR